MQGAGWGTWAGGGRQQVEVRTRRVWVWSEAGVTRVAFTGGSRT